MNKSSSIKKTDIVFTSVYFAIFILSIICTILAYVEHSEKMLFFITFNVLFLLITLDSLCGTLKFKNYLVFQALLEVLIIVDAVANLCFSDARTFDIIFISIILVIFSINFTIKLMRLSLQRVQKKVEFQPVKPIIKP